MYELMIRKTIFFLKKWKAPSTLLVVVAPTGQASTTYSMVNLKCQPASIGDIFSYFTTVATYLL